MSGGGQDTEKSRRKFLWGGLLLLVWPLLRFAGYKVPRKPIKITVTEDVPENGVIIHKKFVLFDRDGKQWALSRKCTHLGCSLRYQEKEDLLECPCHQSRFRSDSGAVINGPAVRPLFRFTVEKLRKDDGYVVTING